MTSIRTAAVVAFLAAAGLCASIATLVACNDDRDPRILEPVQFFAADDPLGESGFGIHDAGFPQLLADRFGSDHLHESVF